MHWLFQFLLGHMVPLFFIFATAIVTLQVWRRQRHQQAAKAILAETLRNAANEPFSLHPEIDPAKCAGCGACTTACPEGDILQLINHKAVLVSPTKCVGHGECERACPFNAIKLVFGTKTRGADIPRLTSNYETNIAGLYIAGELGGMGLIRNAVRQGAMAAQHALANIPNEKAQYDVIIVGAGPAGLAAGLAAVAGRHKYLIIEQNTFGGTIANFPRQKLVMTHPFELPLVGKKEFPGNEVSKEELMASWNEIRQKTGLKIQEGTRFLGIEPHGRIFVVKTSQGELSARKVILAMGVRGTARKLGVPGEEMPKVTYNLIEPEQYRGKLIVVVGGGNAAAEAAMSLADPRWKNEVALAVRSHALDRCNDTNKKRVEALEKAGKLHVWFDCEVLRIENERVVVKKGGKKYGVKNDFVFILAGSEIPRQFLMSLGVKIDKKFGEALKTGV